MSSDETMVEIGGQCMTQAQFDAARYPLLHPATDQAATDDAMSVSFTQPEPEQTAKDSALNRPNGWTNWVLGGPVAGVSTDEADERQRCEHAAHDTRDDQRIGKVPGGSDRFSHWEPCPGPTTGDKQP